MDTDTATNIRYWHTVTQQNKIRYGLGVWLVVANYACLNRHHAALLVVGCSGSQLNLSALEINHNEV